MRLTVCFGFFFLLALLRKLNKISLKAGQRSPPGPSPLLGALPCSITLSSTYSFEAAVELLIVNYHHPSAGSGKWADLFQSPPIETCINRLLVQHFKNVNSKPGRMAEEKEHGNVEGTVRLTL